VFLGMSGKYDFKRRPSKYQHRVNDMITASEVRLISSTGEQLGLVEVQAAIERAKREEMDLVEVAPDSQPPVCKIMDYQRYLFEQKRKLKESRKKAKALELKEVRLRPNIDPHDFGIRLKHVKEFLSKGHKVKVTMRYRPREMRHFEIGTQVLKKMTQDTADVAEPDSVVPGRPASRMQVLLLAPKKKG
jgi:translation initiation factor IF-3